MFLQIFKESHILDANNNIQIANPTYMVCWTYLHFLHLNKLFNIKRKLLVISSTQGSTVQEESSMALLFSSQKKKQISMALLGNYWSTSTPSSEVQHWIPSQICYKECELVCVCLDFLKPKTRINKKVDKKMHFGLRQNASLIRAEFMDLWGP